MNSANIGSSWESTVDMTSRAQGFIPLELDRQASWTPGGFRKQKAQFDRIYFCKKTGKSFCTDLKTTAVGRFPCDKIKKSQLEKLMDVGQAVASGYLVNFRKFDQIVWFKWQTLFDAHVKGESLKPEQGQILGTLHNFRLQQILDIR